MKMISEEKLLALLIEAYRVGYDVGSFNQRAFVIPNANITHTPDDKHMVITCKALVERASIQ